MVTSNEEKFYLKVEKGRKPRVQLFEELRNAQVTIPYDQSTKWPPINVQMSGAITIIVQRLEQQYKITVQHVMERKPDICVFVSALTHERDIRTCVRDINTQLSHIGVAGPNLEVSGRIKAIKVTFESTVGALHTNSKLSARNIILKAQHIFIKPEALFTCSKLRMIARRVQIDGRICCSDKIPSKMSVFIDSALLHIGIDGTIGTTRTSTTDKSISKISETLVNVLNFHLTGCLANFGSIASQSEMEFNVDGSILSLQHSQIDSASRGYTALKQIKGISSEESDSLPTSSTLSSAILYEKPDTVAQLLEDGVDLNDSIKNFFSQVNKTDDDTPRKIAVRKYKAVRASERRNKMLEKITLIQALISMHDWKRGIITSNIINAMIGRDCADCAQFRSGTLTMTIYGNAKCEAKSIWTGGSVTVAVGHDLVIEGQVKHVNFDVSCGGNMATTEESIISQEQWARIVSSAFCVGGIWSVGEQFGLDVESATFLEDSYIEVDYFEGKINKCCYNSGTWQTRFISLIIRGDLFTLHTGKIFVEETTTIEALSFNNCGLWKIKEAIKIILKGSANFYASSKFSANLLKIIAEGRCTIAGHLSLENLLAYIRNDMIVVSGARVNITVGATVAVGTFRNYCTWYVDGNLHLHIACFEQSDNALIFVKDTFTMVIYDQSEERCQGRIVANYLIMNLAKKVRFDCYIRVNQIEISVPHVNESRLTIGGQLEILDGPLILKGRSSSRNSEISKFSSPSSTTTSNIATHSGNSEISTPLLSATPITHSYPAFVLEGQLKAEAVIAPFLAILFSSSSYSLLSGMDSIVTDATYRILISCNSLHTKHKSLIDSIPDGLFPEGILCAATWLHEGQIRFNGKKVYIITDELINRGRLTSGNKLQNHMHDVVVQVQNFFRNDSVFSADRIEIYGNGELRNKNRIFANDEMNIRLANYRSEFGQTQLEINNQPKLLLASNECTPMEGYTEARGKSDISKIGLNRYEFERMIQISARSHLLIANDIIDNRSNITFTARDAIMFKSRVSIDLMVVTLGAAYITEFVVKKNSSILVNQLRITGSCKNLTVIIDGELSCESMIIDARIRQVKIVGDGMLSCKKTCNIGGDMVILTIHDIRLTELIGSMITIAASSNGTLNLSPTNSHLKMLSIYANCCYLKGRILVEHKILLKITSGLCDISGEILGICANSELSLECDDLVLTGTVANLDFLECYTSFKIEHCEAGIIKSVKNIVFEAEFIMLNGKIVNSESVIATGNEVNVNGILLHFTVDTVVVTYSIFGKKILFNGEICGAARLELTGSEIIFSGTTSNLKALDIDANLVTMAPQELKCENCSILAYSAILDGNLNSLIFAITVRVALFIRTDLSGCMQCKLIASIILALNCPMPYKIDISAFIYTFERFEFMESGKLLELRDSKDRFTPVVTDSVNNTGFVESRKFLHLPSSKHLFTPPAIDRSFNNNAKILNSPRTTVNNIDARIQSFIEIAFHSGINNHYTVKGYDLLHQTTGMINQWFKNLPTTYDELHETLKRTDQVGTIGVSFSTTSDLYAALLKVLNEIHIGHQLMRNCTGLFHLICNINNMKDDNKMQHSEMILEERERFEPQALYEIANHFRIQSYKYGLKQNEKHSTDDDIGYVSRSSSEEIDEKHRNISVQRDSIYCTNLDNESFTTMLKVTISDDDDCMDKDTVTDDELRNNEALNDYDDDDDTCKSQKDGSSYNTTYVLNGERRVQINYIDFNRLDIIITKPELLTRRKIPSGIDLAFKKIQLKATLPMLELHSFGSESSLASFDEKALMSSIPMPVKRSLIPRAAAVIPINGNGTRKSHAVFTYDT